MIHDVLDTDTQFIIDGSTRLVKNESETKSMLVQFDNNSERFTFRVPRTVDSHDLKQCNSVRVYYTNIDKSKRVENNGVYIVKDLDVCPDDNDYVCFSWLISKNATQLVGSLHFVIRFACIDGDREVYSWNTAKYTNITISEGLYHEDVEPDAFEPERLATPSVTISGSGFASWQEVQGATHYVVLTDDSAGNQVSFETNDTFAQLAHGQSISVQAISGEDNVKDSYFSTAQTYTGSTDICYYGVGAVEGESIASEFIASLTCKYLASRVCSFTVSPDAEYIYFSAPKSYCVNENGNDETVFTVNGFSGGFIAFETIMIGDIEYCVYRSVRKLTGDIPVNVT